MAQLKNNSGFNPSKIFFSKKGEIKALIRKHGTKVVLDEIPLKEIEKYLRKKKLEGLKGE